MCIRFASTDGPRALFSSLVLLCFGLAAGCAAMGGAADHFPDARKLNLKDIAGDEGKAYERQVRDCVRRDYANTLLACISAQADPDLSDFEMILTIEQDGSVDSICISKETDISECFRKAMVDANLPAPPFSPFHGRVSMRLR